MAFVQAPRFMLTADEDDFDADFDIPEGTIVIPPNPPAQPTTPADKDNEDWDKEFDIPTHKVASGPVVHGSTLGKVTNLSKSKSTPADTESWDDDDDLDLPPPTSKPLQLSLSPRARATLGSSNAPGVHATLDSHPDGTEDDQGNASTIKVSKLVFKQNLSAVASSATLRPSLTERDSTATLTQRSPLRTQIEEDFEGDFAIPLGLAHLSLKPPTLSHRSSKTSLDTWGDHTASSLYSDTGSSLSQPSPSSASNSQPDTEEDEDFQDDGDLLDGLQLPDSLSSQDMKKILDSKKRMSHYGGDRVKVASPADDDFEIGLEIGDDDDLSPSRLKLNARLVGKGAPRSQSAPTSAKSSTSITPIPPLSSSQRPPSRLRNESALPPTAETSTSRPSRGSPPRNGPVTTTTTTTSSRRYGEAFPTLRRATSTVATSLRSATSRWPTLSSLAPPPLSTNPAVLGAASSRSSSSFTAHRGPLSPSSTASATSPHPRSPPPVKHQKSYSRLPSSSFTVSTGKKLSRKASLSSLDVVGARSGSRTGSSHSPSPSPELVMNPSRPPLPHANTLSHATSMRDISRRYDAPTASSRARKRLQEQTGFNSDREPSRGPNDRAAVTTSGSRSKPRAAVFGIFADASSSSDRNSDSITPGVRSTSPQPRHPTHARKNGSPTSTRIKSMSTVAITSMNALAATSSKVTPPPKMLRKPKRSRVFGDGTELDGFDDLPVERDKEMKYRVTPSGSGNVKSSTRSGTIGRSSGGSSSAANASTSTNTGTVGRRGLVSRSSTLDMGSLSQHSSRRPPSSASSQGSIDIPRQVPTLRHRQRVDFPPTASSIFGSKPSNTSTPPTKKASPPPSPRSSRRRKESSSTSASKRKPTLIRNLSGSASPKVVGDMRWNPQSLRWEGNDAALRDFEVTSSSRPALITHFTGSSAGGLGSPANSFSAMANSSFSALASGARVVGDMMFDPVRMCWINRSGDEEDAFAGFDEEDESDRGKSSAIADDEDWDEEGKGGTIRAVLTNAAIQSAQRRQSGLSSGSSSVEGSPARSHGRSASESDSESITGSNTGGHTTRESSLGGGYMACIEETFPEPTPMLALPPALMDACRAAEDRHRHEMKGWNISSTSSSTLSRKGHLPPAFADPEPNRSFLFDIRALATRKY